MKIVHKKAPVEFARFGKNIFGLSGDDSTVAAEAVIHYFSWLKSIQAPQEYADIAKPGQTITCKELETVAETAFSIYHGNIGRLVRFSLEDINDLLKAGMIPYSLD